jgi:hypothetical protein
MTMKRMTVKKKGLTYQGKPCKHGHSGVRYVVGNGCVECSKAYQLKHAEKHRKRVSEYQKEYKKGGKNPKITYNYALNIAIDKKLTSKPHIDLIAQLFGFEADKIRTDIAEIKERDTFRQKWLIAAKHLIEPV